MEQDYEMLLAGVTKFDLDVSKHLTTLSTGAIILLATFMDKLMPVRSVRFAIPIAVVCFLLCIMYSVKLMMLAWACNASITRLKVILVEPEGDARTRKLETLMIQVKKLPLPSKVAFQIVQYSFALGIISVGVFVVANLK
jgi:hypothetical protein